MSPCHHVKRDTEGSGSNRCLSIQEKVLADGDWCKVRFAISSHRGQRETLIHVDREQHWNKAVRIARGHDVRIIIGRVERVAFAFALRPLLCSVVSLGPRLNALVITATVDSVAEVNGMVNALIRRRSSPSNCAPLVSASPSLPPFFLAFLADCARYVDDRCCLRVCYC